MTENQLIINQKKNIMRKILGLISLLALVLITACDQGFENAQASSYEVISIHDLILKPGVDEKEFEAFTMNNIAPLYKQLKGQDFFLRKGYTGQRTGQYALFLTFETVEDRDRIYPFDIGFSEEFQKVMEGKDSLWEKFESMASGFDGFHCTDYIIVGDQ